MEPVKFDAAETYEPEEGWRRVSMAGSDEFSFEWFEKPPGHSSPMHDHENEQVCICLQGELTLYSEDDEVTNQRGRFPVPIREPPNVSNETARVTGERSGEEW